MPSPSPAAVTARGVREGDRAALAALVDRRGAAVLAYCDHLSAPGRALEAAGEAFADFRRQVRDAEDPRSLDPEKLLLNATRRAAAARAPRPEAPAGLFARRRAATCQFVPELLAARAADDLSTADRLRLARHLERCADCRAAEERFVAAERAYADAPSTPPEAGIAGGLLAALRAAAPNADERRAAAAPAAPAPAPASAGAAEANGAAAAPAGAPDAGPPTLSWDPAEVAAAQRRPRWRLVLGRVVIPTAVAVVAALTALIVAGAFSGGKGKDGADSIQTEGVLPATTVRVLQRPATTPLPPRSTSAPKQSHATARPSAPRPQPASAPTGATRPAPAVVRAPRPAPTPATAPLRQSAASLDARSNGGTEAAPPPTGGAPAGDEPGYTPAP